MEFVVQLVIFTVLVAVGLLFGSMAERRHFARLRADEAALREVLVFSERRPPPEQTFESAALVVGAVVLGEDYFKRVAAALRSFFGGRLIVYESLMDRGRREAVVRMKRAARELGATMIFNVRFETSSLSEDRPGRSPMFSAEFLAYGTALVPKR